MFYAESALGAAGADACSPRGYREPESPSVGRRLERRQGGGCRVEVQGAGRWVLEHARLLALGNLCWGRQGGSPAAAGGAPVCVRRPSLSLAGLSRRGLWGNKRDVHVRGAKIRYVLPSEGREKGTEASPPGAGTRGAIPAGGVGTLNSGPGFALGTRLTPWFSAGSVLSRRSHI